MSGGQLFIIISILVIALVAYVLIKAKLE